MARYWIKDINYEILEPVADASGNLRRRHWSEQEPPSPGRVHPQWRQNLNDNMLMNLFASTTFSEYYRKPVQTMLQDFYDNMATIPWYEREEEDPDERARLHMKRIRSARLALDRAIDAARKLSNGVETSVLYTTDYDNHSEKDQIDNVLDALTVFERRIKWLCMPFLRLKSTDNPNGKARPTPGDLTIHLLGSDQAGQEKMGLGRFNFEQFLFYKSEQDNPNPNPQLPVGHPQLPTDGQTRWNWYKSARRFATDMGFLDDKSVTQRALERSIQDIIDFTGASASKAEELLASMHPSQIVILSNSNGYKCKMQNGVKIGCEPGLPTDYCVNNGSQYC